MRTHRNDSHSSSHIRNAKSRRVLSYILILAVFTCCLLSGCGQKAYTLENLLSETNAAHQKISNDGLDSSFTARKPMDENGNRLTLREQQVYFMPQEEAYDPEITLTQEQIEEDVAYLFEALYACYGNYDRMGGQEAFDRAEQAILEECAQKAPLQAKEFEELVRSHLDFVEDAHFKINGINTNPSKIAFFFRETEFHKAEDGKYTTKEGKTVASVNGYSDLDALFKRSISPEGEIVYYPVLLKDYMATDAFTETQVCTEQLTVHYTDESTQELECEPYTLSDLLQTVEDPDAIPQISTDGDIPVFTIYSFMRTDDSDWQEQAQKGVEILGDSKIAILDLRFNSGGYYKPMLEWLKEYAGMTVPTNLMSFDGFSQNQRTDSKDAWIENKNTLIILTSKRTASCAEWMVDAAHNLENVLIIGENTRGAMQGDSMGEVTLQNSKLRIGMGMAQGFVPSEEDYFEEYRGLYPDLWVPAGEAEELANKLIERLA